LTILYQLPAERRTTNLKWLPLPAADMEPRRAESEGGTRPRKPRLNPAARLTQIRTFVPFRALTWAAEMADFGAIDWT
jgi:hypothetical protein